MAQDGNDSQYNSAPFEGPEKLLEIWFAPSAADLPDASTAEGNRHGLRKVDRRVWEEMLDIVKCKVLSVVQGKEIDAYLLRCVSLIHDSIKYLTLLALHTVNHPFLSPLTASF